MSNPEPKTIRQVLEDNITLDISEPKLAKVTEHNGITTYNGIEQTMSIVGFDQALKEIEAIITESRPIVIPMYRANAIQRHTIGFNQAADDYHETLLKRLGD